MASSPTSTSANRPPPACPPTSAPTGSCSPPPAVSRPSTRSSSGTPWPASSSPSSSSNRSSPSAGVARCWPSPDRLERGGEAAPAGSPLPRRQEMLGVAPGHCHHRSLRVHAGGIRQDAGVADEEVLEAVQAAVGVDGAAIAALAHGHRGEGVDGGEAEGLGGEELVEPADGLLGGGDGGQAGDAGDHHLGAA